MKSLKPSAWAILLTVLLVQGLTFLWVRSYFVAEAKAVDQNTTQLRAKQEDALPKFDADEPGYPAPGEPSDPPDEPPPDEPSYPAPDETPPREPGRYLTGPNEGEPLEIAQAYIEQNIESLQLVADDLDDVLVNDQYVSQEGENQVTHIYLRQRFEGIEVAGADININIASDGSVINVGNRFVENLDQAITQNLKTISAIEATELAAEELGLTITEPIEVQSQFQGPEDEVLLSDGGISLQEIPAKLVYQPLENGDVHLAWDLQIYETSAQNYWNVRVDAASGTILEEVNWVTHDHWGTIAQSAPKQPPPPFWGLLGVGFAAGPKRRLRALVCQGRRGLNSFNKLVIRKDEVLNKDTCTAEPPTATVFATHSGLEMCNILILMFLNPNGWRNS